MAKVERPYCDWLGGGKCLRPAIYMVGLVHNDMFWLSCKDHLEKWGRHGQFYWTAELRGYFGEPGHEIEDILHDNERRGKERRAAETTSA